MAILGELARSASELDVGEAREGLNAAERLLDLAANHLDRPEYLEYLALTSRWAKRWGHFHCALSGQHCFIRSHPASSDTIGRKAWRKKNQYFTFSVD